MVVLDSLRFLQFQILLVQALKLCESVSKIILFSVASIGIHVIYCAKL